MIDEKLTQTILNNTYTKQDLQRRVRLLRQYVETQTYKDKKKTTLDSFLKDTQTPPEDTQAMKTWGDSFWSAFTKKNLYSKLKFVKEELEGTDIITIFTPIQLDGKGREQVGYWFRKNVSKSVIIDIRYDPTLSIGCALVYNGVWADYSLHYLLRQKRDEIISVIGEYDKT